MRILYNLLINLILIFSPLIIVIRLFLKKEHPVRFIEKFSIIKKKRYPGNLIWFHSVSIGELLSIIPLIEKFEKNKKINQILITSSTKTSAKLFEKFKFKKTIHQFFPIDNNYFVKKFINYWKPKVAIFVDSEIWPNMLFNLEQKKIKKILLNARISRKSYKKWNMINFFTKTLFLKFDYIYPQNKATEKNIKKLKLNKIKSLGNLKLSQQK